jgi:CBS domain containing-hemolysin-like protein
MRQPYFIPENKRVDDLLADFRGHKSHLAIVRDEYGTVTGIVSIEDILEEIVGDIQDEYDLEEPEMSQVDARTSLADGRMPLGDFNERMGTDIPTEEADTLGGFVFGLLGHQPEKGEETSWNGLRFRVEATDGRRLQKVLVTRIEGPWPLEGAGPDHGDENASSRRHGAREEEP